MFIYSELYKASKNILGEWAWSGVPLPSPFYANTVLPVRNADSMELCNIAMNAMVIQRDASSFLARPNSPYLTTPRPYNISYESESKRNQYTEYNSQFDGGTEGGDISYEGETLQAVIIRRTSSRSRFQIWEDIAVIPVTTGSMYSLDKIIYDPYVEHGITYRYAIQPIGSDGRGSQYETLNNKSVYDDVWLVGSDTKSLMMGYNPVVSNYKHVVKDVAIETIGSKYPYVIRNANVGYSQFQFSCMITAHMNIVDGQEIFTSFDKIETLDEYKDVVINDSTGETGPTGDGDIPPRPTPIDPDKIPFEYKKAIVINENTIIRTEARIQDGIILTHAMPGSDSVFNTLERNLPGGVRRIEFPTNRIPAGIYDKVMEKYSYLPEPPEWIEAFVDEGDLKQPESNENQDSLEEAIPRKRSYKNDRGVLRLGRNNEDLPGQEDDTPDVPNDTVVETDSWYMIEREFRRRVLDYLHDGKPKIFKSPTEGLLLVKLSNITLTPNTALGRMIYDFSCTMTEIGKVDGANLTKYGFRDSIEDAMLSYRYEEVPSTLDQKEVLELYGLFK